MTKEQINRTILEALGWKRAEHLDYTVQETPHHAPEKLEMWEKDGVCAAYKRLAKYTEDLNACRCAEEEIIEQGHLHAYLRNLWKITNPNFSASAVVNIENYLAYQFVSATAPQRAEALYRTFYPNSEQ